MYPRQLDVVADAAFVARTLDVESLFRKCGEKSETAKHNLIFGNKTAGRGRLKQGLFCRSRLCTALPKLPAGSMR